MLALEVYKPGSANQRSERAQAVFNFQSAAGFASIAFDLVSGSFTVSDSRTIAGPPSLDGKAQVRSRPVHIQPGSVVRWAGRVFVVAEVIDPSVAEQELLRHAQINRQARDVYADWLESRGALQCAEYVRLIATERSPLQARRLADLAGRISASFRAMVTRAQLLQCREGGCPQRWEALEFSTGPCRTCTRCHREIELCDDLRHARELFALGPLAIEPWVPGSGQGLERATPPLSPHQKS